MKIMTMFRSLKKISPLYLLMAMLAACATPPDYPVEPVIEFVSVSRDTVPRGRTQQEVAFTVTIDFTDGDGDIGTDDGPQLFITDTRDGGINDLNIPVVEEKGASNGIKGTITARVFTDCCDFPPELFLDGCEDEYAQMPYDIAVYSIYMEDRAGNRSNTIQTPEIYIRCFD